MAQATAISLAKFTSSVQSAVKSAVAKHPKFRLEAPSAISDSYLIRGFPVPDAILSTVTLGETQAFANEVAASLAQAHPEILTAERVASEGAVISIGKHVIIGVPSITEIFQLQH